MAKMNPIQLQKFLKGVGYPAKKNDLIKRARDNGAKADIISVLEELNKEEFNNPAEVSKAVSQVNEVHQ